MWRSAVQVCQGLHFAVRQCVTSDKFETTLGGLAQLARALAWHARGHRFDSDILHVALYARAIFDKLIKQKKKRHETRLIRSTAEVCVRRLSAQRRESEKGRTEDALALTSDEGRDKLR